MELSPQAYEFSQLVLKNYNIQKPPKTETKEEDESQNPQKIQPPSDPKTKYSMDYRKFEEVSKEADEKKQSEDPFKTNPYLAQMGCSHDRRKVCCLLFYLN